MRKLMTNLKTHINFETTILAALTACVIVFTFAWLHAFGHFVVE